MSATSWKFNEFTHPYVANTDPEKRKNVPKGLHETYVVKIHWTIFLWCCSQTKRRAWCGDCETVLSGAKQSNQLFACVMPNVNQKLHENPLTCFSVFLLANTDPENRKMVPGSKGSSATYPKLSRLFIVSMSIYTDNIITDDSQAHGNTMVKHGICNVQYSTTICKHVDLLPALHQSDCRIPIWDSAKTVHSSSTNHGQTTVRFRSFFRQPSGPRDQNKNLVYLVYLLNLLSHCARDSWPVDCDVTYQLWRH